MRVAVVDIGTNSTRLLVADVAPDGAVSELERRSTVTRLGQGVDTSGALAEEAMDRVRAVLTGYRACIDELGATATRAVLTSAVRDARNGAAFTEEVRERFGLDARTLPGEEEARLTFLGATSERADDRDTVLVVIDVGGGSTEFVVGAGREVRFEVSTQAGVVRQTERHLHDDPPTAEQVQALVDDVARTFADAVPADVRASVQAGIAVAGTATSSASITLGLEPYDPDRVHGFTVTADQVDALVQRMAALPLEERRDVAGLHPDRAPTIIAGMVLLREALRTFGLAHVEVSEHDILRGAALSLAREATGADPPS
ncbi:Ppx/GppA phosphatase family protein [Conexibacter sp. SYSU D00693]|uniref:Ppx/GppA phosphatase family protein n=1 Tax=Conexibacter sp. SYSU D00693 TaxID=2812560 RepID=UPI00196ACDB4|nr:Ppx/GppA phosphatase family protein [Conexibacter sp. SYSU D00693]